MNLEELKRNWTKFGQKDPLWAIITWPDKKGRKWRLDEFFETGEKEISAIIEVLDSVNPNLERKMALDFGCGVGRLTLALAAYFDEVSGVDIAPSMIKLAKKYNRYGNRCKYYTNEAETLEIFADNKFDFVYSNLVLQHMRPEYSKGYIREMLRVLKPGGILIFQLPSERSSKPLPVELPPQEVQRRQSETFIKMKRFIKSFLPRRVLDTYHQLWHEERDPIMEMYGVRQNEVLRLLTENGGKILDVVQNDRSGPYWISLRYCVTKG